MKRCKHCGAEQPPVESMMVAIACACEQSDMACIDRPYKLAQTQFEEIKAEWQGTICETCKKPRRVWSAEHKIDGVPVK